MELDTVTGLDYVRARWYDPAAGKFLNPDPLGFAAGDPNLQRYVANAPTNAVDPTGLRQSGRYWGQSIVEGGQVLGAAGGAFVGSIWDNTVGNGIRIATVEAGRALGERAYAKAVFAGNDDPSVGNIVFSVGRDLIGEPAIQAISGYDVSGNEIAGGLFDGGPRSQMPAGGVASFSGAVAGLTFAAARYTPVGPRMYPVPPRLIRDPLAGRRPMQKACPPAGAHPTGGTIRPVGQFLNSVDDILKNPQLLRGRFQGEVEALEGKTPGWRAERLGQGAHKGQGWLLRQYGPNGKPTGELIQWHPGGGHHGPAPYWKVSSGLGGTVRVGPQF